MDVGKKMDQVGEKEDGYAVGLLSVEYCAFKEGFANCRPLQE